MTKANIELGDFLRSRRNKASSADSGLPSHGQRRVPGLRREEVAMLAGVSTSYYTRIEQGTAGDVSQSVIDALARALSLDPDERAHLFRLAGMLPGADPRRAPAGPGPGAGLESVVRGLAPLPAGVLGPAMEILAWNDQCHRIFGAHLPFEAPWTDEPPNWIKHVFTDPVTREILDGWEELCLDLTGRLRGMQGRFPDHPGIQRVVAELSEVSEEFRRIWAEHPVRDSPLAGIRLKHPIFGELELTDVVLRPADDEGHLIIVLLPQPGSPTEQILREI